MLGHEVIPFRQGFQYLNYPLPEDIDFFFHLSAYGNHFDQQDPIRIYRANTEELWEILNHVKNIPIKGFFNFSTSGHVLESDTFYGATKMAGEYLARAFARQYKKPIVNIRPYSIYGPGEAEHRFIPTIIRQGLAGGELELSEGVHDWMYIDDFIDALMLVMDNVNLLQQQSIDMGTGEQTSNREVADILSQYLPDLKIKPLLKLDRQYDTVTSWKADTSKLAGLGILRTHSLKEGLWKTLKWYEEALHG